MNLNLHYGKLSPELSQKINSAVKNTLAAGSYKRTEISDFSLDRMREFSSYVPAIKAKACFACSDVEVTCPEDSRVECLCGRTFFKYHDITDYDTFVERSRWNLFWNRLFYKT